MHAKGSVMAGVEEKEAVELMDKIRELIKTNPKSDVDAGMEIIAMYYSIGDRESDQVDRIFSILTGHPLDDIITGRC